MAGATGVAVGRGVVATGRGAAVGAAGAAGLAAAAGAATALTAGAGAAAAADPDNGIGAPVGPPGGSVGSLMVGAAVGLGGKLIRTVSFLGWTLPVDFFNGSAPEGVPGNGLVGGMSAIGL